MSVISVRGRLLASTLVGGVALLAAGAAFAQAASEAKDVEEVVVTGSRIKRVETTTPAPVTVVDAQEILDLSLIHI